MLTKVLVANRGAIARRIIRACQALNIASVAVYSEADRDAPYLAEATEALPLSGNSAAESYLDHQKLLAAAVASGADSVHPGYGFLAENAGFAAAVIAQGMTFIGPDPHWIDQMGDKVNGRRMLAEAGMPVFAGSELIDDLAAAEAFVAKVGLPVVVKPSGGGGGIGMHVVRRPEELSGAINAAVETAQRAFASAGVFLERWIEKPRHIEFQILADLHGNAMHLYERDCSVQRRHQKLIEESPAPGFERGQLEQQAQQFSDICQGLGYNNLGTVETLFAPDGGLGFLEMNTRIQVEHGVTEEVTGIDLVATQITLAAGGQLPRQTPLQGFAMEVRLYAEDSQTLFPSTGTLTVFRPPELHGVRIETGYREGQVVTPYYDPLLAKIIARGTTREQAIGRLVVALRAFTVRGVSTNAQLLLNILQDDLFVQGQVDTGMVARILAQQNVH
jgi:acetyl-CoA carboxylase biotin carboxylase subunit